MFRVGDYISPKSREQVILRAKHLCEYCLMPDDPDLNYYMHQIDHIKSIRHWGASNLDNLAYSCFYRNSGKGADLGSIYDLTGEFAFFYNPRKDNWDDHFELHNFALEPISATGWVTAMMLQFNTPARIDTRRSLY